MEHHSGIDFGLVTTKTQSGSTQNLQGNDQLSQSIGLTFLPPQSETLGTFQSLDVTTGFRARNISDSFSKGPDEHWSRDISKHPRPSLLKILTLTASKVMEGGFPEKMRKSKAIPLKVFDFVGWGSLWKEIKKFPREDGKRHWSRNR